MATPSRVVIAIIGISGGEVARAPSALAALLVEPGTAPALIKAFAILSIRASAPWSSASSASTSISRKLVVVWLAVSETTTWSSTISMTEVPLESETRYGVRTVVTVTTGSNCASRTSGEMMSARVAGTTPGAPAFSGSVTSSREDPSAFATGSFKCQPESLPPTRRRKVMRHLKRRSSGVS